MMPNVCVVGSGDLKLDLKWELVPQVHSKLAVTHQVVKV